MGVESLGYEGRSQQRLESVYRTLNVDEDISVFIAWHRRFRPKEVEEFVIRHSSNNGTAFTINIILMH